MLKIDKKKDKKSEYRRYKYIDYTILQKSYPILNTSIRNSVGSDEWFKKQEKLKTIKNYSNKIHFNNYNLPKISKTLEDLNSIKEKRLNIIKSTRSKCKQYCDILKNRNEYYYMFE